MNGEAAAYFMTVFDGTLHNNNYEQHHEIES